MSITKRALLRGAVLAGPAIAAASAKAAEPRQGGPFITRHAGRFNGQDVDYVATVGETVLRDAAGAPALSIVSTAYVRQGLGQAARPIIFAFNGGPSVASATLHMAALGQRRLVLPQDPTAPIPATPSLTDNLDSILDAADIVLIDPPETGFSRVLGAARPADFYEVNADARAISDFIRAWVKASGREASPRYLLGESYGTIRAAVMAGELAADLPLDGVFLFGQAVNMIETSQRPRNALAYATNLPALATVAAYHGRATRRFMSQQVLIDETYAWGMGEYLQALLLGRDLPAARRRSIARTLQTLTGISAGYYLDHDLIISKVAFAAELLRDRQQILAAYDARYVRPAPATGQRPADPFDAVAATVRPAMATHLRDNLAVAWDIGDYQPSAPGATAAWGWSPTGGMGGPFLDYDYAAQISKAFKANSRFRLMIGTGVFDLTTTIGPARYLVARSDYPLERVIERHYQGGHMAYTNLPALRAFAADLRAFVRAQPV